MARTQAQIEMGPKGPRPRPNWAPCPNGPNRPGPRSKQAKWARTQAQLGQMGQDLGPNGPKLLPERSNCLVKKLAVAKANIKTCTAKLATVCDVFLFNIMVAVEYSI